MMNINKKKVPSRTREGDLRKLSINNKTLFHYLLFTV